MNVAKADYDKAVAEALAVYDKALAEIEAGKETQQVFLNIGWLLHPVKMARHWFKGDLDSLHEEFESNDQKARDEARAVYEKNKDK